MADAAHLSIFFQGPTFWNDWRKENPDVRPDLSNHIFDLENLSISDYSKTDFTRVNLNYSHFVGGNDANRTSLILDNCKFNYTQLNNAAFYMCRLEDSIFFGSSLHQTSLMSCSASKCNFNTAKIINSTFGYCEMKNTSFDSVTFRNSTIGNCQLQESYFCEADLRGTSIRQTNLESAQFYACKIYGLSTWDIKTDEKTITENLNVNESDENPILIDNLHMAQFVHLIINNANISSAIDTVKSKMILILGRFNNGRKEILDAIKKRLGIMGYTPVIFDFAPPRFSDLQETVKTLMLLSKFVIVDITEPSSSPFEMSLINDIEVPIIPIIEKGHTPWAMMSSLTKYPWILATATYDNKEELIANLENKIVNPAIEKFKEVIERKRKSSS